MSLVTNKTFPGGREQSNNVIRAIGPSLPVAYDWAPPEFCPRPGSFFGRARLPVGGIIQRL